MHFLRRFIVLIFIAFCSMSFATVDSLIPLHITFANLEAFTSGCLGVSAIDTFDNATIQYRSTERFPMASTYKFMLVSAILKQNMFDSHLLQQKIFYTKGDINASGYAPVTEKHIATGMTVAQLCQAAITQSDNVAANILTKKLGGPQEVTAFARSIGDDEFRLDRKEPELNTAVPGDLRDTTTPIAMANSLEKILLGNVLRLSQRQQLQDWLKDNTTGNARIHAGMPKGWVVGDKTGTGGYGTTNDIGIIWPPHCSPVVVAIYFRQNNKDTIAREDVIASATRIILNKLAQTDHCIQKDIVTNTKFILN